MIEGYNNLNENITKQIDLVSDVSKASQEQRLAIEQINESVSQIDKATQQNASMASQMSSKSKVIQEKSQELMNVVNNTSYDKSTQEQICDFDMFIVNKLKLDHINFKNESFKKLNEKTSFKVTTDKECELGKWIRLQEQNEKEFTKSPNWIQLKELHNVIHKGIQDVIDDNAHDNLEEVIHETQNIDKAISNLFFTLNQVKKDNCVKKS